MVREKISLLSAASVFLAMGMTDVGLATAYQGYVESRVERSHARFHILEFDLAAHENASRFHAPSRPDDSGAKEAFGILYAGLGLAFAYIGAGFRHD
jgi:hypothetical protein